MSQTTPTNIGPLTVVLVHGAFADASSWTGVIERLQAHGVRVTAPANPLRGVACDSATSPASSTSFPARSWPLATPTAVQ
jgi:hypothetical protein